MNRVELCENVVSTDYIENNVLHYYTYATEWTDTEHIKKFNDTEQAIEWYEKNMHDKVVAQGKYWLEEDNGLDGTETEQDCIDEWRNIVESVAYYDC